MKNRLLAALFTATSLLSIDKALGQDAPASEKHFDKDKYKSSYTFIWLAENPTPADLAYGEQATQFTDNVMATKTGKDAVAYNRYVNLRGITEYGHIASTMSRMTEFETDIYNITLRGHGATQWKENKFARYPVQHAMMSRMSGTDDLNSTTIFQTMSPYLNGINYKYDKNNNLKIENDNNVKMVYSSCHPLYALVGAGNMPPKTQILFLSDTANTASYQVERMEADFKPEHFLEAALLFQNTVSDSLRLWNRNPHVLLVTDKDGTQDDVEIEIYDKNKNLIKDTVSFGLNRVRVLDLHKEASRFWKTHNKKHVNKYFKEYDYLLESEDMQKSLEQWIATETEEEFEKLPDRAKRVAYVFTYRNVVDSPIAQDNLPNAKQVYQQKLIQYKPLPDLAVKFD